MNVGDFFLKWIFPLLGGFTSLALFLSPIKAVLWARREKMLGDLNPLPFAAQTANSVGWIAYAYVLAPKDLQASALVYWPNQLGFMLGLFYTLSCYGVAPRSKVKDRLLAILMFFSFLIPVVGAIGIMLLLDQSSMQTLFGILATVILVMFYTSPLSTIITVIRLKSAATLYWPLAVTQIVNGALWTGYGLAIHDTFIWGPNAVGCCTGVLLVTLCIIFRDKKARASPPQSDDGAAGSTTPSSTRELTRHSRSLSHDMELQDDVDGVLDANHTIKDSHPKGAEN